MASIFETLSAVNVNDKTEEKNGLTYLSWAWAWAEVKKVDPAATYTIYEDMQGRFYHTDGRTCWVKTGVTAGGIEHIEYLPVMDYRNASISAEKVTSFDVNKAIQRSLTKAVARHGLGLYIYAGEDLPEQARHAPTAEDGKELRAANAGFSETLAKAETKAEKIAAIRAILSQELIDITCAQARVESLEKFPVAQLDVILEKARKRNAGTA